MQARKAREPSTIPRITPVDILCVCTGWADTVGAMVAGSLVGMMVVIMGARRGRVGGGSVVVAVVVKLRVTDWVAVEKIVEYTVTLTKTAR